MRNKLTKILGIVITAFSLISFCGCNTPTIYAKDGTTIVCTIFPIYDWVCELTEGIDNVNVVLLAQNGADMHSFQPTVSDFVKIADCDMFIYVGGESEEWIDDCLSQNPNEKRDDINLSEVLASQLIEESDTGIFEESEEEEEDAENDEHIWLSLKRSITAVEGIADCLENKNIDSAKVKENRERYVSELQSLDKEYEEFFSSMDNPEIIVVDRFPFRYLTADYGISYYAAFSGCTTETDASFDTIIGLADVLSEGDYGVLFITEAGDEKLAETVMEQAGKEVDIAVINSIQSVGQSDIDNKTAHYLSFMRDNLNTFRQYVK